jgi:hypothetical protein
MNDTDSNGMNASSYQRFRAKRQTVKSSISENTYHPIISTNNRFNVRSKLFYITLAMTMFIALLTQAIRTLEFNPLLLAPSAPHELPQKTLRLIIGKRTVGLSVPASAPAHYRG